MDYSEMGLRSWDAFVATNGKRKSSKLMSDKGRKGWLALVGRFGGDEDAARLYTARLGRASFYRHTRPGFAQEQVKPYFEMFPNLAKIYGVNNETRI